MKMTVITRDDGEIVGTVRSRRSELADDEVRAEVVPLPGQNMLEIDVPDEVVGIEDPDELHRRVRDYLPKRS